MTADACCPLCGTRASYARCAHPGCPCEGLPVNGREAAVTARRHHLKRQRQAQAERAMTRQVEAEEARSAEDGQRELRRQFRSQGPRLSGAQAMLDLLMNMEDPWIHYDEPLYRSTFHPEPPPC